MTADRMGEVQARVHQVAERFAGERAERARRTSLDPADFAALAEAGFVLTGVPASQGGLWRDVAASTRDYCSMLREIARADPSVALVAAMHPSVLAMWLAVEQAEQNEAAWREQREANFASARAGEWWGTVISEPGSGGDPAQTRAVAHRSGDGWRISGEKHFGSGSGQCAFMVTTAVAEGESRPDIFVVDMRERAWDGSDGLTLRRAWDGHGMRATQSHAFQMDRCPVVRAASLDAFARAAPVLGQLTPLMFAAVILGVVDQAQAAARASVAPRRQRLRPYEQVSWLDASNKLWLAEQAFEGALRAVEAGDRGMLAAARAKLSIAQLVEDALGVLSRVVGGASFSQSQPFGQWAQDVRALGFLRPPWGYAYDQLLSLDLPEAGR